MTHPTVYKPPQNPIILNVPVTFTFRQMNKPKVHQEVNSFTVPDFPKYKSYIAKVTHGWNAASFSILVSKLVAGIPVHYRKKPTEYKEQIEKLR